MTLREARELFTKNVALLIQHIFGNGYSCTLGEVHRPQETANFYASIGSGIKNSMHCKGLAVDVNLFKDGKYLTSTKSHELFGDWWELQHPNNRWGGRFGDGNHYEMHLVKREDL